MTIYLRELEREDIAIINKWRNNKKTIDFLGTPFRYVNKETDLHWFDSYVESRSNNVRLAICDSNEPNIIGLVYLLAIDWINRAAEFAIWIGCEKAREKKIGFKALQKTISHAFLDLNLHRLYLTVLEDNKRAISLYKKSGFLMDGVLREAVFKNGQYSNTLIMSLLCTEYTIQSEL